MEYQKIINFLDNTSNQPPKFKTNNWLEINDESRGKYNTNSQIRFETSMLRSSLCNYTCYDAYIIVKGNVTVTNTETGATPNNAYKKVIFKDCVPFTSCIHKINNTQIDDA